MIEFQAKKHDNFSIEFKVGYIPSGGGRREEMSVNMWIFVPNSLDLNADTYTKGQFYRDLKSNVRLITPVFLLREIAGGMAIPLSNLRNSFSDYASEPTRANAAGYEYGIKMFMAIFKSAIRDETTHIIQSAPSEDTGGKCRRYLSDVSAVTRSYRELRRLVDVPTVPQGKFDYFLFGDEFMSNTVERQLFRLIMHLRSVPDGGYDEVIDSLAATVRAEREYRKQAGYPVTEAGCDDANRQVILRQGVLKKYIESDLFLRAQKKRDGVAMEQFYLSIAAGLSMIFATAVAFSFQQRYGNFTMPLFVALVVSYMLKDRIKDTMRYFFAHRLKAKYFDNKTLIGIGDDRLGHIREGVDFIPAEQVPQRVTDLRGRSTLLKAEHRISDEKIILYRKMVQLDPGVLHGEERYSIDGINDIMRLYLSSYVLKTDNPEVPVYFLDDENRIEAAVGEKIYYLNFVVQLKHGPQEDYKRYRVIFTRNGIRELEEIKE